MYEFDVFKVLQIFSALFLGGVLGWFISSLTKAEFPVAVLITLSLMGVLVFFMFLVLKIKSGVTRYDS